MEFETGCPVAWAHTGRPVVTMGQDQSQVRLGGLYGGQRRCQCSLSFHHRPCILGIYCIVDNSDRRDFHGMGNYVIIWCMIPLGLHRNVRNHARDYNIVTQKSFVS